jgi:uncharacterized protein
MKWTLGQLAKIQNFPYRFKETFLFKEHIHTIDDLIDIGECEVEGKLYRIDYDTYRLELTIKVELVIACALTLNPVKYPMNIKVSEIYSTVDDKEYNLIDKNTIDLSEIVWTSIIIEKPIKVVSENARQILKERGINLDEDVSKYYDKSFHKTKD